MAGFVIFSVVLGAFVADLFEALTINETVANTFIMAAAAMLGIGVFERKN